MGTTGATAQGGEGASAMGVRSSSSKWRPMREGFVRKEEHRQPPSLRRKRRHCACAPMQSKKRKGGGGAVG